MVKEIGKCPHCGNILSNEDIIENDFKGSVHVHIAYTCRKCKTIIGFSAINKIS